MLLAIAEGGDLYTQERLGNLYESGIHIPKDLAAAVSWYQKASDQGDQLSATKLREIGQSIFDGTNYTKGIEAKLQLMQLAPFSNNKLYQTELARAFVKLGRIGDALPWFRKAAKQDDRFAQTLLGNLLIKRKERDVEIAEGKYWLIQAAKSGYGFAQNSLGSAYELGRWGEPDFGEAVRWYSKAVKQEDREGVASNSLGNLYWDGRGVPQDYAIAADFYRRSAKLGHPYSIGRLGEMLIDGKGA